MPLKTSGLQREVFLFQDVHALRDMKLWEKRKPNLVPFKQIQKKFLVVIVIGEGNTALPR